MRIAHITDLHLDEAFQIENGVATRDNFLTVLKDLQSRNIDQIVCAGDIGTPESHTWLFQQLRDFGLPFRIILGNHDSFHDVCQHYDVESKSNVNELYYAEENKHYKYLFLDTSTCKVSKEQLNWIAKELNTAKKVILFSHHPILNTGTTPQLEYPLDGGNNVEQLLLAHEREVKVFCGHLHMDHRTVLSNVEQFISPATCLQVKKHSKTTEIGSKDFGFRIIELNENGVDENVIMFEQD